MNQTQCEVVLDIETTGLNPLDPGSRITAIAALSSDQRSYVASEQDEMALVRGCLEFLAQVNPSRIYGYNVNFDARWLLLRAVKYRLRPHADLRNKFVDVRKILAFGEWQPKGTLSDYALFFNIGTKLESSGQQAVTLWQQGEIERLKAYCAQDVALTAILVAYLREVGLL